MRVIGGEFRSRRLKSLPGQAMRPTPDMLRETLFNVLAPLIPGCTFVDAYAGSGAVGIEALSRGAGRVYFVESHPRALAVLEQNLKALKAEERAVVIRGRTTEHLSRLQADIFFLDPPYDQPGEYGVALRILGRKAPPVVVVQCPVRMDLPDTFGKLRRTRILRQGNNALSFYSSATESEEKRAEPD